MGYNMKLEENLTNIQKRKLLFLLERDGEIKNIKITVKCPAGVCDIDQFGRVEWIKINSGH